MAEWWASPEMAGVEAEKGKLSAAAELACGVERKADPSKPLWVPLITGLAPRCTEKNGG